MGKEKQSDPEVGMYIALPASLRDKVYGYLETERGALKHFIRGLIEDFFEHEDWVNLHMGQNRRKKRYWNKRI